MLPIHPSKLPAVFQDARRLQAAGKLDQAMQQYKAILGVKPDLPEVHFQLAQVLAQLGDLRQSITHLDRAAKLKPGERAIWQGYAEIAGRLGDPKIKAALLARAKAARIDKTLLLALQDKLRPKVAGTRPSLGAAPPADIQRVISLLRKRQYAEAAGLAGRLRKAHPDVALIADLLASALAQQGKPAAAEAEFRAAVRLDPDLADAREHFGHFLLAQGRAGDAIAQLNAALKIRPDAPNALADLGLALAVTHQNNRAIVALQRALALEPGRIQTRLTLARTLLAENRFDEIEAVLEPVRDTTAVAADVLVITARALAGAGDDAGAEAAFDAAIAAAPGTVLPLGAKALFLQHRGRFDEAETLFRDLIAMQPDNGYHYQLFLTTKKLRPDDPLISQIQAMFDDPSITKESRMYFGFALAKVFEDIKEYPKVFNYLRVANDTMRQLHPYDVATRKAEIDAIKAQFSDADFGARAKAETSDYAPIFVTGLPRSGTTLVEQIIASHSTVRGGGELGWALSEVMQVFGPDRRHLGDVSDAEIARIGNRTAERMQKIDPDVAHITDKSVQSYTMIGPLRLALPRAKIVVVRRDPRDNLLSIYKNRFDEGMHLYSYNLRDLAVYYQCFQDIIEFWRHKTPTWFHEIEYEALIANPEQETRKLIAACGLDWEDECLSFHRNTRRVDTLSVHQVRQPLYASSMKAWERYADDLGDLIEALGGDDARDAG